MAESNISENFQTRKGRFGPFLGWKRQRGSEITAATVDLLASFSLLDKQLSTDEASLLLDLLRGSFPEIDRAWLTHRLGRALRSPKSIKTLAQALSQTLETSQREALALQIYVLAQAGSGRKDDQLKAFSSLCTDLQIPETAQSILNEISGQISDSFPFLKVSFGAGDADVQLPAAAKHFSFVVYQSASDTWVRNTGSEALWVQGHTLQTEQFVRIIEQQFLAVPEWRIDYDDICYFLNAKQQQNTPTLLLGVDDGQLVVSRSQSRLTIAKVELGTKPNVTSIKKGHQVAINDQILTIDKGTTAHYSNSIELDESVKVSLEHLRKETMRAGGRFRLNPDRRECLVSNVASGLRSRDVLLTSGLAGKTVLRILFDPDKASGLLEIIESDGLITVDGVPVRYHAELSDGALIRLSQSQAIRCRFDEGILDEERTLIRSINIQDLSHRFPSGTQALDGLNFSLERGELVCIMGPSGCGKSSLLEALSGYLNPQQGKIEINGIPLYKNRDSLLPFIAHMPQEEALSSRLTVRQHLLYAFTVRRPHLSPAEHRRRVDAVLSELGLEHQSTRYIGSAEEKTLSGGERGRLDLGQDLGNPAEIILIDEPTSGLSSKDSEHLTHTLRSLARDKIVICSLHAPGSRVLKQFDKVILLDQGGRLAFFGTPTEMGDYFLAAAQELQLPHPLESKSSFGADFVFDVMETPMQAPGVGLRGSVRRFPPSFWQERFTSERFLAEVDDSKASQATQLDSLPSRSFPTSLPRPQRRRIREIAALFWVHLQRAFYSKFRSRGTIYSILLEPPLLAALIGVTLRASPGTGYEFGTALHIPIFLFLTVTIAMFLGLTNSATEILRDGKLLRRERNCRQGATLYTTAKFLTLAFLASLQSLTFLFVGEQILELKGMFWHHWTWMTLTACCGTALALLVSALVRSERAALSAVPLILVPQMLLAGALVPFDEMNRGLFQGGGRARDDGAEPVPARIIPLRYAFEGILVTQALENPFARFRQKIQTQIDNFKAIETLDDSQSEQFTLLRDGLLRLHVAEASSAREAQETLDQLISALNSGSIDQLKSVELNATDSPDKAFPISHFFASERVDKLLSRAEISREDYRRENSHDIFFAEKKHWFGFDISTRLATALALITTILSVLTMTVLAIRWRYSVKL